MTLVVATVALGVALMLPMLFSDPNGVDPYVVRLSATVLLLTVGAYVWRRLGGSRPVLLALTAVICTFTLFSAAPQILVDLFGVNAGSGAAQVFWASLAQMVLTAVIAALAILLVSQELRPWMRLGRFGPLVLVISCAGIAVLVLGSLALPATLLGRLGIQPVEIGRDLPWLGPASAMQAFSQELQFRGMLMGALERVMPRGWANLAQACFFGLTHLAVNYQGPVGPFVPLTILVGLLFGWMVQRTGSLWPAVIIHAAADIAITVAVLPGLYGF